MSIPEHLTNLIVKLLDRTRKGKLQWKEGATSYSFVVSFNRFSVDIADSGEPDGTEYTAALLNQSGDVIDSFVVWKIEAFDGEGRIIEGNDFDLVSELWELARRSARSVDEAVREIEANLDELATDDEPPFE